MTDLRVCRHCGDEFELRPGKPGLVDECPAHSREVVELTGGNMIWDHKTAPYIETKPMREAQIFANKTKRGLGGVLRSITASREPRLKEGAGEHASYTNSLGERCVVKGKAQQ